MTRSPRTLRPSPLVPIWLQGVLLAAVFAIDVLLPADVPVGAFYAAVMLLPIWSERRTEIWLAASASVCIVVGVMISTGWSIVGWFVWATGVTPASYAWLSGAIAIASVWIIAVGVRRYRLDMDERGRALRRAANLEGALDSSAIVAATDVKGDITYANETFCRISKYDRSELIGRNHRMLNSGEHPPEFFVTMWRTIANGGTWRGEIRNRAKDGSFYWVDTTIVPLLDERGKPHQYLSIRYDITARKADEHRLRDQAALVQLGRMAAVVAHEVRNPLAGIRGALQIIESRLDAASRERAVVKESIHRVDVLNAIVEDMLMFARPRPPVLAPVDLARLAAEVTAISHNDPAFAAVRVDTSGMVGMIRADAGLLKLTLVNLMTNSAQAMKSDGAITLRAVRRGDRYDIVVADTGPGIPADVLPHLFEPFFTTKSRGTGLGLATVRRLTETQGGTVSLASSPTGGAVATLTLPAASPA